MSKKLASVISSLHKHQGCVRDNGFSMLETIWVFTLILALSIGGFFAYSQITGNAKKASLDSAAADVYMAALSAEMDGDDSTTSAHVQNDYNNSQEQITVIIISGD